MDSKFKALLTIITLIFLLEQLHFSLAQNEVKVGYWFPDSGIQVEDIDSSLFTHLICSFAKLDNQTNQLNLPSECSTFPQIIQQENPSVKAFFSIGGGSVPASDFDPMASNPTSRKTFIDSSINLARSNGFHGLDLDWEQQTMASEMSNLGLLLDEWRAAVNNEASSTGKQALILTAAVNFSPRVNSVTYPTQSITMSLDWVHVMAYDFYTPQRSTVTRSHAALFDPNSQVSGSSGIKAWINAGVPANKLVLGFPFYGYAYKLVDPNNHGLLAPAAGIDSSVGSPRDGSIAFNKIQDFINRTGATTVFDSTYVTGCCYSGTTWIGFDGVRTIAAKAKYVKDNGLLGYFVWHVAADSNWILSKQAFQSQGAYYYV